MAVLSKFNCFMTEANHLEIRQGIHPMSPQRPQPLRSRSIPYTKGTGKYSIYSGGYDAINHDPENFKGVIHFFLESSIRL
jgi:hypothetical protein